MALVAGELGVSQFAAGLKPSDKIARLTALAGEGRRTLMVGDGLNDAPALETCAAALCFGLSISWFRERSAPASASPSRRPGNGILWAETGGRFQPQNVGERPEFGSQTATRLTDQPELRGFLPARKPVGLPVLMVERGDSNRDAFWRCVG